jgi:hypothetical protein
MSRATVAMAIEELLTDEQLRVRFAIHRAETLAELCLWGFDLDRDEFDRLCRTQTDPWFLRGETIEGRRH